MHSYISVAHDPQQPEVMSPVMLTTQTHQVPRRGLTTMFPMNDVMNL